mmetsp:Transcript_22685/g.38374  ORF Transcript_22685/g.38374 Transcript_22685/m.38374 type:complete len:217 (-) Transcript_22685:267-917(-)
MSSNKRKLSTVNNDATVIQSVEAPLKSTSKKAKNTSTSTVIGKIIYAIRSLKSANGSSLPAISKCLLTHFEYDNANAIKKALKKEVASGVLIKNKASYLVSGDDLYEDLSEKVEIQEIKVGADGPIVEAHDTCTISYIGTLYETGAKFDSGKNFTFTLGNGDVIKGMESVIGMKVGGRRKLIIPASLGYGARGSAPDIPPHAVLCFDITLKALSGS